MPMNGIYPQTLNNALIPMKKFGGSMGKCLSFDCFVTDYKLRGPFGSNAILKLFLFASLQLSFS